MPRMIWISSLAVPAFVLAPAPAEACAAWNLVFFDSGSAAITPTASGILDNQVYNLRFGDASSRWIVTGHADTVGSSRANFGLSRRRAEAVRDYLAARGFPSSAIEVRGQGEAQPLVDTRDEIAEPQNRYVEIVEVPSAEELSRRSAIPDPTVC